MQLGILIDLLTSPENVQGAVKKTTSNKEDAMT
jgi:hypothetical protein